MGREYLTAILGVVALIAPPALADLKVVATTPEYGSLCRAIGGEHVKVSSLAKPTEDPHYVDARPSHIVTMHRADVLVESGADLEVGWLPVLVNGARNGKIVVGSPGRVLASEAIALLDVPSVLDRSQGDIHARGNPHFMMDPRNAAIVARHVTRTYCALDPDNGEYYRRNLASWETRLQEKTQEWEARLAPFHGQRIVTYHNTWRYFANRFGLKADLFLEPKPGIPPSPPHLARVIAEMKAQEIKVILVEPFQSRRTAQAVASRTGARVLSVAQFPGGLEGTDDYFSLMDAVIDAVASGLGAS